MEIVATNNYTLYHKYRPCTNESKSRLLSDKRFVENKIERIYFFFVSIFSETCNIFRPAWSANQNAQLAGHYH